MNSSPFIINTAKLFSIEVLNLNNSDCTICRCNLNTNSIYHQEKGLPSKISTGLCGHSYHEECISGWLNTNNKHCPICSKKWENNKKIEK